MGCMRCRSGEPRYRAGRGVCGACKWAPCARDAVPWALRSHGTTRLLAAVGYFIAVGWVGDKVQYVTGVRSREADRQCGERPLPDLLLSVLPNAAGTGMLNVVSFAVVAMAFSWAWVPRRAVLGRRWLLLNATALLLRCVTIVVTSPPAMDEECLHWSPPMRWWSNLLFFWYKSCGDTMYSGHTCSFMLFGWMTTRHLRATLTHWGYQPSRLVLAILNTVVWVVCLFAVLTLLLTRSHYTVDVVVAMAVSSGMFILYHCWLVIEARLPPRERTAILQWLEGPDLGLEAAVFAGSACSARCALCAPTHYVAAASVANGDSFPAGASTCAPLAPHTVELASVRATTRGGPPSAAPALLAQMPN